MPNDIRRTRSISSECHAASDTPGLAPADFAADACVVARAICAARVAFALSHRAPAAPAYQAEKIRAASAAAPIWLARATARPPEHRQHGLWPSGHVIERVIVPRIAGLDAARSTETMCWLYPSRERSIRRGRPTTHSIAARLEDGNWPHLGSPGRRLPSRLLGNGMASSWRGGKASPPRSVRFCRRRWPQRDDRQHACVQAAPCIGITLEQNTCLPQPAAAMRHMSSDRSWRRLLPRAIIGNVGGNRVVSNAVWQELVALSFNVVIPERRSGLAQIVGRSQRSPRSPLGQCASCASSPAMTVIMLVD